MGLFLGFGAFGAQKNKKKNLLNGLTKYFKWTNLIWCSVKTLNLISVGSGDTLQAGWMWSSRFQICSRCHSFGIFPKFCRVQLRAHPCWERSALLWVSTALWHLCHLCDKTSPRKVALTSHLILPLSCRALSSGFVSWPYMFKYRFWMEKLASMFWPYQVRGNSLGFVSRKANKPQLYACSGKSV